MSKEMHLIKNIIWDLDGTLFDTYPTFTKSFFAALSEFGHSADPQWILGLTKVSFSHCASVMASRFDVNQEELENAFWKHYRDIPLEAQPLMEGAKDLCHYTINAGGMNVIVTHRDRSSMTDLLKTNEIDMLFKDCIAGDEGYPLKPDPSSVEAIMERNDLEKECSILVGDREIDIEAGLATGIRTCLLDARNVSTKANYHVEQLGDLLKILQEEKGY
jgi:HAD superfamily hydrolase (TIGR01549 family)